MEEYNSFQRKKDVDHEREKNKVQRNIRALHLFISSLDPQKYAKEIKEFDHYLGCMDVIKNKIQKNKEYEEERILKERIIEINEEKKKLESIKAQLLSKVDEKGFIKAEEISKAGVFGVEAINTVLKFLKENGIKIR